MKTKFKEFIDEKDSKQESCLESSTYLKIYKCKESPNSTEYEVLKGSELYSLELGKGYENDKGYARSKYVGKVGSGYISTGRLVKNPPLKMIYICQNLKSE